jgi:hypothetical protein
MITITLNCDSVQQLQETLRALLNEDQVTITSNTAQTIARALTDPENQPNQYGIDIHRLPKQPPQTNDHVAEGCEQFPDPKQESQTQPSAAGKRKRRTKAEIEADKAAERSPEESFETKQHDTRAEDAPAAAPVSKITGTVSKENVHQALQQVNVAVGLPKAREILASFKVNRISEIKEDQYKAFVDKCNEAVMLEG